MQHVVAYLRPSALEQVLGALAGIPVAAIAWSGVRGYGRQKEHLDAYRPGVLGFAYLPRIRLTFSCPREQLELAIAAVRKAAATGAIGDGKILVLDAEVAHA